MFDVLIKPFSLSDFDSNFYLKNITKLDSFEILSFLNFSWDSVNKLLNTRKIEYTDIFVYKNNKFINPKTHLEILRYLSDCCDLLIPEIDFYVKEFKNLKVAFEDCTKCKFKMDLYLKSPSFNLNNLPINQELFLLVIDGIIDIQVNNNEFIIKKGEAIYIPASFKSFSINSSKSALILIINLEPNNAYKFFNWFLNKKISNINDFYDYIDFDKKNNQINISENSNKKLEKLKELFIKTLNDSNNLNDYYDYLVKEQTGLNTYNFPSIYIDESIDNLDNKIFFREKFQSNIFEYEENFVIIYFWKKKLTFPIEYSKILELIFSKNDINSQEIIDINQGQLDNNQILYLLNRLINLGILKYSSNI